jgi:uncharacterized protein YcbX
LAGPPGALHVSGLFVHPVKSCAGIAVERWPLTPRGLRWDRHWMLVTRDGKFASQRSIPRLSQIRTALEPTHLVLHHDALPDLRLPLARVPGVRREVEVWDDVCLAEDQGDLAADWFTRAVDEPLRLVRKTEDPDRTVDSRYAPPGHVTDFADGFPVLVTTEASLAALNQDLRNPVDMRRFRANVVIAGSQPWAEDAWRQIRIETAVLALVKPCARCSIVTVDPDSGQGGAEPLRTLARLRNQDGKVLFGQNVLVLHAGEVAVGDRVVVVE